MTDNSHTLDDFSGYSQGDISPDSDIKDPLNAIFYHVSPLKDSTNITFYNRPLYENIIQVLGKDFANFPSKSAKTFRIKTHVDRQQCFLTIDRSVLSLCASGPGHTLWREKTFKKLSENMYKSFVKETNSVLNTSLLDQDNASLSGSQVSTQHNQNCQIDLTNFHLLPLRRQLGKSQLLGWEPGDCPLATSHKMMSWTQSNFSLMLGNMVKCNG